MRKTISIIREPRNCEDEDRSITTFRMIRNRVETGSY